MVSLSLKMPAFLRRAFCLALWAAVSAPAAAPVAPPELAQIGKPDAEEAERLVERFRSAGLTGDFYLEFQLKALPRQGEERVYDGRLWGGRRSTASVFRVEVTDAAGFTHRLLLRNGAAAQAWRWRDGRAIALASQEVLTPLIPGTDISAFDLQMPFLYWPGATVERITRVWGRPANAFLFRAPEAIGEGESAVAAVRAYLDAQFNALMQTELIGPTGRVIKTSYLVRLKKVEEQHIPKEADYRNEITRDKTRLEVTAAFLNAAWPVAIFEPESLAEGGPVPERLTRIAP
jgi:hypothetical protein